MPDLKRPTITGDDQELLLAIEFMRNDLWVNSDNLLLGAQCVILLELEISDSPGQCQVTYTSVPLIAERQDMRLTVNSAKLDETTSALYSSSLL
jgi:hypothetical protein